MTVEEPYHQVCKEDSCDCCHLETRVERVLIVLVEDLFEYEGSLDVGSSYKTCPCPCECNILACANGVLQNMLHGFAFPFQGVDLRVICRFEHTHPFLEFVCVFRKKPTDQDRDTFLVSGMGQFQQLHLGGLLVLLVVLEDMDTVQLVFEVHLCLFDTELLLVGIILKVLFLLIIQRQLSLPKRNLIGDYPTDLIPLHIMTLQQFKCMRKTELLKLIFELWVIAGLLLLFVFKLWVFAGLLIFVFGLWVFVGLLYLVDCTKDESSAAWLVCGLECSE